MSDTRAVIGPRSVAALVDLVPVVVVALVVVAAVGDIASVVIATAMQLAYFAWFESRPEGQTPGKRVMHLRTVDADTGGPLVLQQALVRAAMRYVSGVACLIGFLWVFVDKEQRTWHDIAARTLVVQSGDQAA